MSLKNQINEARAESKELYKTGNSERVKSLKKQFRRLQRRNIFNYEQSKARNIENLYQIKDKNQFWKAFNSFKNSDKDELINDDNIEKTISHFTKLFNDESMFNNLNFDQKEIINIVNNKTDELKLKYNTLEKKYINSKWITECIDSMKPSNARGCDGLSNNMIKNGKCDILIQKIKELINFIFNAGIIPKNFNKSIILPIIKDKKKRTFDVNNLRPISISNCF